MDVASEIVLRLADPVARPSVLTAEALLAIGTVAYELDPALVTEPATATFDRFDLAVPLGARVSAPAQFRHTGEPVRREVSASWDTGQAPPGPLWTFRPTSPKWTVGSRSARPW
jgi:hypothetical protein